MRRQMVKEVRALSEKTNWAPQPSSPSWTWAPVQQVAEGELHRLVLQGFDGLAEHPPLPQLAGGDQVQHLLRLDLQILLPLGEGLEPGLAAVRGVVNDLPLLLDAQGVRPLLHHGAVCRLVDGEGPGVEVQGIQKGGPLRLPPGGHGVGGVYTVVVGGWSRRMP